MTGTGQQTFDLGNKTVNNVTISSRTSAFARDASSGTHIIGSLTLNAPLYYLTTATATSTINALTAIGTQTNQIAFKSNTDATAATVSTASALSCTYCAIADITIAGGGSLTAPSSLNFGNNTGVIFGAGGGCILGGWLLWRDMPEHLNDNFPAWLEKTG